MPAEDIVALQSALLNLSLKCYEDQHDYGNKVLGKTREIFDQIPQENRYCNEKRAMVVIFRLNSFFLLF